MELKAVEIAKFFRVDVPDLCIVMVYHQALNISVKNFQIALKRSYWIYGMSNSGEERRTTTSTKEEMKSELR